MLDAIHERAKTATFSRLIDDDRDQLPSNAPVRLIWQHLLDSRLNSLAEVVFIEQYARSECMSQQEKS